MGIISLMIILTIPLVLFPSAASSTEYTFTPIDVPNSTVTQAYGINNSRNIVGLYGDATGGQHGFLYVGGSFTPIDVPGSSLTYAYGINNSGNIVGYYQVAPGGPYGFLDVGGNFTTINVPGSSQTFAYGINNSGNIVGYYAGTTGGGWQGFLDVGGNFTTINVPGSLNTYAYGINDSGNIVGVYEDATRAEHGFLYVGGIFTTLDVPGSTLTRAFGINDSGDIVGTYNDTTGAGHGFIASPVPKTISIDIKPASINLKKTSQISVAILSTEYFDAPSQVEKDSLTFGRTGSEDSLAYCTSKPKDLNRDGVKDLLCYFYIDHTGFQCGYNLGILNGYTVGGVPIIGSDSVTLIHCR